MLKAAIEKILSLDEPHIKSIEGRTYVDKNMTMIGKELRADGITMNTLSSLVDFIKKSTEDFKDGQYIVQVVSGLSTLFQTNFFRLFFRYCTGV